MVKSLPMMRSSSNFTPTSGEGFDLDVDGVVRQAEFGNAVLEHAAGDVQGFDRP